MKTIVRVGYVSFELRGYFVLLNYLNVYKHLLYLFAPRPHFATIGISENVCPPKMYGEMPWTFIGHFIFLLEIF